MAKNLEIIEQAIELLKNGLWANNPDTIKSMLFEFVSQNTGDVKPIKNLSVWDCTGNDPVRPILQHVFLDHLNKVAVGMDGHIIFINPGEYKVTKSVENGEVINKDYTEYDDKSCAYPDYHKFIPADDDLEDVNFICVDDIKNFAKQAIVVASLSGNETPCIQMVPDNADTLISTRLIPYILSVGIEGWKRHKKKPMYVKKFDGKTIALCGIYIPNNE